MPRRPVRRQQITYSVIDSVSGRQLRFIVPPLPGDVVGKILDQVGRKVVPPDINIDNLAQELGVSSFWYSSLSQLTSRKRSSEHLRFLTELLREVDSLQKLLRQRPAREWFSEYYDLPGIYSFAKMQDALARISEIGKADLRRNTLHRNQPVPFSPFEWLVGEQLPSVYKKFLREDAGSSHSKVDDRANDIAKIRGPYIRFALGVLNALRITKTNGMRHSPEAIIRALTLVRSGANRKKAGAGRRGGF